VVADVEETAGTAIVTPRIPVLDCERWENEHAQYGSGYAVELERFDSRWIGVEEMSEERFGYLSPALIGCCFAVSRRLYDWLWGMDRDMVQFGIEDLDFGLKAWLMGSSILHDPRAVIGHRFQQRFDNYTVDAESILSNSLRMARKNFSEPVWEEWVGRARLRYPEDVWRRSWSRFEATRASAERERTYLLEHRVRDELDYAARFGLEWPRRSTSASRYLATSR
jgi:hypothetical protein